jgi:ATP-binding cassette subfamily B protein
VHVWSSPLPCGDFAEDGIPALSDGLTTRPSALLGSEGESSNIALIRRMLALAWQFRLRCLIVVALRVGLLALVLSGLSLTGLGIDVIRHAVDPAAPAPHWPLGLHPRDDLKPMAMVWAIGIAILVIALMRGFLQYAATVTAATLVQKHVVVHLRGRVYDKLQRLSFRFFDANNSGSIINRVTVDVQRVGQFISQAVLQSLNISLTLVVYIAFMLNIHGMLTLACLATTPVMWWLAVRFSRRIKPGYRRNRELVDHLITTLSEHVQGVHVVKGFARETEQADKFRTANAAVRDQAHWTYRIASRFSPTIHLLSHVNLVVLLGYGGWLVLRGELQLGTGLIVFAGLLQQFASQVQQVAQIANTVQVSLTGAARVFEILDAPLELTSPAQPTPLPRPRRGAVRFENVSFSYDGVNTILQGVDLEVPALSSVAIVGATGSGKSTLLSLIPRFYDPTQGRVLLDGVDVRQADLDELRRDIGLVFQESFLFSQTVAANIAFGHPDATPAQIEKAARIAQAHDFIMALPLGYDTVIGERGVDLSGGQRQRLAIARAVLLEPAILIMDDPTAAIDPQTESEILAAMDNAMRGRTTFVVAHRLSTLRRADRVVVLEHGRIVQAGTHDELMNVKGHYRRAAKLQIADPESRRLLGLEA